MSNKSHVAMEHRLCVVCGVAYETGAVLLDKRLRKSLDPVTITGVGGTCPVHSDRSFVHLIGCSGTPAGDRVRSDDEVTRTGEIASVKVEVWPRIFDVPVPPDGVAFVEQAVIDYLKQASAAAEQEPTS